MNADELESVERDGWFVTAAGMVGDLGNPYYREERQRDVWNEAAAGSSTARSELDPLTGAGPARQRIGDRSPFVDRVIFGGNTIETGTVSYRDSHQKPDVGSIRQLESSEEALGCESDPVNPSGIRWT